MKEMRTYKNIYTGMNNMVIGLVVIGFYSVTTISCTSVEKAERTAKAVDLDDYRLAYNVMVDGEKDDYDIFTMELDGSDPQNVTRSADVAWTYLASGDQIFFISDRDTAKRRYQLFQMNSDGRQIKRITNKLLLRDSWMDFNETNGELIVCPHYSIDTLMWIINLQGELIEKLSTGTSYASDPCFSPDGSMVAFVGQNSRSKRAPGFNAEIYRVNRDGSGLRQLTHYPESDTTAEWYAYKAGPPKWHPTENFISYQSKQNGKYSLYAVAADGSRQWKLTDNAQEEGWHDWSPDGKWLAIELFNADESQFHIGLMDWTTKELKILTDTTYQFQQAPVFIKKTR